RAVREAVRSRTPVARGTLDRSGTARPPTSRAFHVPGMSRAGPVVPVSRSVMSLSVITVLPLDVLGRLHPTRGAPRAGAATSPGPVGVHRGTELGCHEVSVDGCSDHEPACGRDGHLRREVADVPRGPDAGD